MVDHVTPSFDIGTEEGTTVNQYINHWKGNFLRFKIKIRFSSSSIPKDHPIQPLGIYTQLWRPVV